MKPFCDDVHIWLNKDDRNVAVIHCDDGLVSCSEVANKFKHCSSLCTVFILVECKPISNFMVKVVTLYSPRMRIFLC